MMNTENVNLVIDYIKKHPEKWDQKQWCGNACCIAGHAQRLAGLPANSYEASKDAKKWFGIFQSLAQWLFSSERVIKDFEFFLEHADEFQRAAKTVRNIERYAGLRRLGYLHQQSLGI